MQGNGFHLAGEGADTLGSREGRGGKPRGRTPEQIRAEAAKLVEAMPPHAIEAEMALLGALLLEYRAIGDVVSILKGPEDFSRPAHGVIFRHMLELYQRDSSFDMVQLNQRLIDRGVLEAVGGLDYLIELAQSVPSASFAVEYARLVRDKAIVRSLIGIAGEILVDAHGAGLPAQELLQAAEARIFAIAQQSEQVSTSSLKELLDEALKTYESQRDGAVRGVSTGYQDLDNMTSGLQPGEVIVLAARPSMGKTAFALNLAENIALAGAPVAVFSLEMSRQQLVQRLVCSHAGIDGQKFRRAMLSTDEFHRIRDACGSLAHIPIFIDDTAGLTLLQMRAKSRRLKERFQIACVVIDYLQLMSAGTRVESRQLEVSEISRGVKAMARELNLPVVCLSQLNRASEQREGHRPRMSDLRESGSIEQDADVVMMLHREDYYHAGDQQWTAANQDKLGVAELIIAKQRNGPTGSVTFTWDSGSTRFKSFSGAAMPGTGGWSYPGPRAAASSYRPVAINPGIDQLPEARADLADGRLSPSSAFAARRPTGPVDGFRDGGGPDPSEWDGVDPLA